MNGEHRRAHPLCRTNCRQTVRVMAHLGQLQDHTETNEARINAHSHLLQWSVYMHGCGLWEGSQMLPTENPWWTPTRTSWTSNVGVIKKNHGTCTKSFTVCIITRNKFPSLLKKIHHQLQKTNKQNPKPSLCVIIFSFKPFCDKSLSLWNVMLFHNLAHCMWFLSERARLPLGLFQVTRNCNIYVWAIHNYSHDLKSIQSSIRLSPWASFWMIGHQGHYHCSVLQQRV